MSSEWLVPALSESLRKNIHAQLDELIALSQRCPYVLSEQGERAVANEGSEDDGSRAAE